MNVKKILLLIIVIVFILFSALLRGEGSGICIGERIGINSDILGCEVPVLIHLPAGYKEGKQVYPLIYKFNGDRPDTFVLSASTLQAMAGNYHIPEVILADIAWTPQNKYFLLQNREKNFREEPVKLARFITDELIPHIDSVYRTAPYRILYGQSNAGMFTIYMMFEHGKKFNAFIATSPMIGWHKDYFLKKASLPSPLSDSKLKHLAIIFGEKDLSQVSDSLPGFHKILGLRNDIIRDTKRISGAGHTPYAGFYKGLRSVFRGWKYTGDLADEGELERIKIHYSDIEKRFGFNVDPPYYLLFKLGFNLYRKSVLDKSETVFHYLLDLYPGKYQARFVLARIYAKTSRAGKATDQLRILLELQPGYKPAETLLKNLNPEEREK